MSDPRTGANESPDFSLSTSSGDATSQEPQLGRARSRPPTAGFAIVRRARAALVAVVVLAGAANASEPARPEGARNVVILFQDAPNVPALAALNEGLRRVFQRVEGLYVYTEHLDLSRFTGAYEEQLRRWLREKYASVDLSLVVAVGAPAVVFATRPDALWPGVPVVFCAVDDRAAAPFLNLAGVTGIIEHHPIRETMDLALRLFPDARTFALLGGASEPDRFWLEPLRAEAAHLPPNVRVIELFGMPMEETLARLATLPRGTPIMAMSFFRDGAGRPWTGTEVVRALDPVAPGPVFTTYDVHVGRGGAGGVVLEYEKTGVRAAELALRVIGGESTAPLPVQRDGTPRVILDWRVLQRWGVDEARIPRDAEVRFRNLPPWREHPLIAAAIAAALLVQAALILVLLLEHRRRRLAESTAAASRGALAHMGRVGVASELAGSLAHEINTPIASIQNSARAMRRLLGARSTDEDVEINLAIIEGEGQRAGEIVRRLRTVLRRNQGQTVRVDPQELAREAIALVAPLAKERGAALSLESTETPVLVEGDRVQLLQVLLNLLLNAVDAAAMQPSARRNVAVRVVPAPRSVRLEVIDSGSGFSPEARARAFEPFFTTKEAGLGMGLSICRTIVEAHGGRIWIGDAPYGASVNVELPGVGETSSRVAGEKP